MRSSSLSIEAATSSDLTKCSLFLIALAENSDTLKALRDIVSAAEARMAVALANVEGDSGPDTGGDETKAAA